eukprot:NODE_2442_length_569_cov_226.115385_g2392_i0.p1 GENE.NODE_2442_length_569_cov_226.115385_g2392_i0~~NODE_2442_length_569_cov_226.115385_g2392_i0.p1  ORF type:complete len:140 (-),score=27.32 NODE_2442_length_569_cov_226.115385_g2392_i0:79-498(-)
MSDVDQNEEVPETTEEEVPTDLAGALKEVLKRARNHDGLAIGLHECAKALDKRTAHLCILAEDCSEPAYLRLVEALCKSHGIDLIRVPERLRLGEWAGTGRYNADGTLKKAVGASCVVIKDYGEASKAQEMVQEQIKGQ